MAFDQRKLQQFPSNPGVYLMKDGTGMVLYVGKARNLKQRVKQYFVPGRDGRMMVPYLVSKVESIETIVVFSEKEALILESNLIKQHQPRYNALLKDDKAYIALKITTKDKWPCIKIVRYKGRPGKDGLYFGPYTSAKAAKQTLDLLNRLFPLRRCSDQELARRVRPCLLYQMKRCAGPCANKCTTDEYNQHLKRTIKFLRGQDKEVLKELYEEMEHYSDQLEFEKAAKLLETIRYIEKTIEAQHVDRPLGNDADVLGLFRSAEDVILCLLIFRQGRLMGTKHFSFGKIAEEDTELLETFLLQNYDEGKLFDVPEEILLPHALPNHAIIQEILLQRFKRKISLACPVKGDKKTLQSMAQVNAQAYYQSQKNEIEENEQILLEMQEMFGLNHYPSTIECFDTSNTSGDEPVASMVTFKEGKKEARNYRLYRLNSAGKPDDYAAMYEVLTRRYKRAKNENELPELVVVDGGKGQLGVVLKVFTELNISDVDIIGLAKEQGRHDKGMTEEQIFLPHQKEPLYLAKNSPVLFLLQKMRDEAHRFAISFHRKRRAKKSIKSALDAIPGIGPAKKKALIKYFGSVAKIKEASIEDLLHVKGINQTNAEEIVKFYT